MLRVTIDGVEHVVDADQSILDAAHGVGVDLPALCYDPRIEASGSCRACLVEVRGASRPVAACTTGIADGMTIATDTPELQTLRRELLGMLARSYPQGTCDEQPHIPFHQLLRDHGVPAGGASSDLALVDTAHPYIRVDLNRCILCFRCVRICDEVQGQFTWRLWDRGAATRIAPDSGTTLRDSSCVSCGACVDTCPTGALEDETVLALGPASRWTRTVCPYCGVGCELEIGTRGERIIAARPVLDAPASKGHLCVKGRYAHGFVHADDRVTSPMIRSGDRWDAVSWDEAIAHVAAKLTDALRRHGPSRVGMLGSARATNEDNYLTQKFARVALGTNNIDCCARVCHAPSAAALEAMLGTGAATSSFDDIEHARTILVCGSNTTEGHPIVGARIKQAKRRGANLIVIDPRSIELSEYADVHLRVRPGANVALLNAIAHVILDEDLVDHRFAAERVDGLDELRPFLAAYAPEAVAVVCGVDPDDIRRAARLYAGETPSISFHGLGVTEHQHGTDMVTCLINLALLSGNIGKPGAGVNPLRGQNNVQGAALMGCEPDRLTGSAALDDSRPAFEAAWGVSLSSASGLDATEMIHAAAAGELRALWVIGWDIALTNPDTDATRRALHGIDLVVVQDLFFNETAREIATVFLPACSSFERDGTFMNSERRIQRVRAATSPIGASKPDWEVLCLIAQAMRHRDQFRYTSVEEIWEEVRRVWPAVAGITYERLEAEHGLQWPCRDEADPGTQILHAETFPRLGPRATFALVPYLPPGDATDAQFPLVLVTGRNLYQFNAGTMTMRTPNRVLRPTDTLEISPDDARNIGIGEGERIRVTSRYGTVDLPAEITARVRSGEVFTTFNDPSNPVNRVTGPHQDARTHTPEYKVTAVHLDRMSR